MHKPMSIQQEIYILLSIPFYHSIISFQYISACEKHHKAFVLLPQKMIQNLPWNLINILYTCTRDLGIKVVSRFNEFFCDSKFVTWCTIPKVLDTISKFLQSKEVTSWKVGEVF
jgi:hypothetical protein